MDITQKFWNSKKHIEWFKIQPVSVYWLEFFEKIPNKSRYKVLDLGCGGGRHTEMLAKFGFDFYACDYHSGMVDETMKRLINLGLSEDSVKSRISQQPMDKLSFPSSSFDFVISHGVYHNAFTEKEYKNALKESARILKNKGLLCFNVFSSVYTGVQAKIKKTENHIYITKDNLPMVLFSKNEFLDIAKGFKLFPFSELIEYTSKITTGKRSVLRGILIKLAD